MSLKIKKFHVLFKKNGSMGLGLTSIGLLTQTKLDENHLKKT